MTIENIPNLGKRGKEKQNREQYTFSKHLESANKKIGSEPLLRQNRANDKRRWRAEHAFTAPDTSSSLVAVSTWAAVTRSGRRPSVPRYPVSIDTLDTQSV